MTTTTRAIASLDLLAVSTRESESWLNCYCCGEAIENTPADRRYARVANGGRLFCSGECAIWCALFHDTAAHGEQGSGGVLYF